MNKLSVNSIAFLLCLILSNIFAYNCPDYSDPHTMVVTLSPSDNIRSILYSSSSGTSYLLESGIYNVDNIIQILNDDVTIRSVTGNRDDVILDGNAGGQTLNRNNFISEILQIRASNVTIANLTIRYAQDHGLHLTPQSNGPTLENILLHNIRVYDCGEQLIKVNSNGNETNLQWVDNSILECSLIEFVDNSIMQPEGNGYYTGGLDVHGGKGWVVRGNIFRGIENQGASMEHAVHMWSKCRGTIVENNYFKNNWRAIGFGMKTASSGFVRSYPDQAGDNPYFDHVGGMIRNNVIYNEAGIHLETGVELMNVSNVEVYHNTVVSTDDPFNCMEYRYPNTSVTMKNNICSHQIMPRDNNLGVLEANIENAPLSFFEDPSHDNFHLKETVTQAIDNGVVLADGKAGVDMDHEARDGNPDIGADETNTSNKIEYQILKKPGKGYEKSNIYTVKGELVGSLNASGNFPELSNSNISTRVYVAGGKDNFKIQPIVVHH